MSKLVIPDDWEPEIAVLVGSIALRIGALEHTLKASVKRTLGLKLKEGLLFAEDLKKIGAKTKCIQEAYDTRVSDEESQKKLAKILKRIRRIAKRRNEVFHSLIAKYKDGTLVRVSRGTEAKFGVGELRRLNRDILAVRAELQIITKPLARDWRFVMRTRGNR